MNGYRLEDVWPTRSDAVRKDVARFWLAEAALTRPEDAEERSKQLLVVARDAENRVVGVSTAVRVSVSQLGFDCFYYRTFVGRSARTHGLRSTNLVWDILRKSYEILNQRFQQRLDRDVLGIYAQMENPSIMRNCNRAIWQDAGMNFVLIGRTPDGMHQRIWYFDGARVP